MEKDKKWYAKITLANGEQLYGEIEGPYDLQVAMRDLTMARPDAIIQIGKYLFIRAGDFMNGLAIYGTEEDVA